MNNTSKEKRHIAYRRGGKFTYVLHAVLDGANMIDEQAEREARKEDRKAAMYEANMQGDEQPWCWICEEYVGFAKEGKCNCDK